MSRRTTTRMRAFQTRAAGCAGFTLVELVVVIMILGVLAAVAAPRLLGVSSESALNATLTDIHTFQDAFMRYHAEHGAWPPDRPHGQFPPLMRGYINERKFTSATPLGGLYDWNEGYGFTAAVAIWMDNVDLALYQQIDNDHDDGDLNTGKIQKHSKGLNFVIEF